MNLIWSIDGVVGTSLNVTDPLNAGLHRALFRALIQAGWTAVEYGDGTTRAAGLIPSAAAMNTTNAWQRMRGPDGKSEFVFQRGSTSQQIRMKWSHDARFITGGSATQTPSASDEQFIAGGGTDASPSHYTFIGTDTNHKLHVVANVDPPYDFVALYPPIGGGAVRAIWHLGMIPGSYHPLDVAPYVVAALPNISNGTLTGAAINGAMGGSWFRKGLPTGEAWLHFRAWTLNAGGTVAVPAGYPANPYDGSYEELAIPVGRALVDGSAGPKGKIDPRILGWTQQALADGDYWDFTAVAWTAATPYALGDKVLNGGQIYETITAGTSAASGGPSGTGADITDNTVHWRHLGETGRWAIFDDIAMRWPLTVAPVL